jgi:23S rRNA (uracil-5-)-methyltransferase RumA
MDTSWLKIGDRFEMEIRRQGINGEGIGYHKQLAFFVDGAIALEQVECEVTAVFPNFAQAKVIRTVRTSPHRVEAPCPYYDRCGGCQMQHIAYPEQLKIKRSILKQAIKRYTTYDPDLLPIAKTIGQKPAYGYRNKSQMPFRNTAQGLALGLFKPGGNQFVAIDHCMVQEDAVNRVNQSVLDIIQRHGIEAFDEKRENGVLFHLVTRHVETTGQIQVTLVSSRRLHSFKAVSELILRQNPAVKSVHWSLQKPDAVSIFGKTVEKIAGTDTISETIDGLTFELSPEAFHQLNSRQMRKLYHHVVESLHLTGTETIVDGYCGIGITTLLLARKARRVIGVDLNEAAIRDAVKNAAANQLDRAVFLADRVEKALPGILTKYGKPDAIVLDPPRTGLEETLVDQLLKTEIQTIVYISCNPSTLAKNLARLTPKYVIESIQPIDMFPQTASVESVTILKHQSSSQSASKQ